jgi:hypothetical protein
MTFRSARGDTIVFSGGASDEVINANKISEFSSGEKRE